jgi:hypothetical protein
VNKIAPVAGKSEPCGKLARTPPLPNPLHPCRQTWKNSALADRRKPSSRQFSRRLAVNGRGNIRSMPICSNLCQDRTFARFTPFRSFKLQPLILSHGESYTNFPLFPSISKRASTENLGPRSSRTLYNRAGLEQFEVEMGIRP